MSRTPADVERVLADNVADLHSFLLRRVPDPADAADALSDVLLAAWRGRGRLPGDDREARMWLFGVAGNVLRNRTRAQARSQAMLGRLRADRSVHGGSEGSDQLAERVREAIESLPGHLAEIVQLRHWDGFSLEEAATILGIPASTARSRYAAARQRLRRLLDAAAADAEGPSLRA